MNHIRNVQTNGLPTPRSQDLTPVQLMAERVEDEYDDDVPIIDEEEEDGVPDEEIAHPKYYKPTTDIYKVLDVIEEHMKNHPNKVYTTRQLQRIAESTFKTKWVNFSVISKRLLDLSDHIQNVGKGRLMKLKWKA